MMKKSLSGTVATVSLALALGGVARAQETAEKSAHYETVAEHLHAGGDSYLYVDFDGDAARVGKFVDDVLATVSKVKGEPIPGMAGLSIADVVGDLGLTSIAAVGASSHKEGDRYQTRSFLYTPDGRKGLLSALGGRARKLYSASVAPAGADLVIEQGIDVAAVLPVVDQVLRRIGNAELIERWAEVSAMPIEPLQMTLGQLLSKLDTRVTVIGRLDPGKKMEIPDLPVELPQFELCLSIDNLGWLVPKMMEQMPEEVNEMMEKGLGYVRIQGPPMPPEALFMQPLLHYNVINGRLSIATSLDFLKECHSRKGGLFASEVFRAAMVGMPEEANSLMYISKRFGAQIEALYGEALEASGQVTPDGVVTMAMGVMKKINPMLAGDYVSMTANHPDGVLSVTNSAVKGSSVGAASIAVVAIAASVAVPVFTKVKGKAQEAQELNMLRQVGVGLRIYAIDNGGAYPDEIDSDEMIETLGDESILRFMNPDTGEMGRPLYVAGLNDSSPARYIVLASPWMQGESRAKYLRNEPVGEDSVVNAQVARENRVANKHVLRA